MRIITLSQDLIKQKNDSVAERIGLKRRIYSTLQIAENGFKQGDPITLQLKITKGSRKRGIDGRFKGRTISISFPSFDAKESLRFARYLRILRIIFDQLNHDDNRTTTKRQIYYNDVALFQSQSIVDDYVDSIADCLGVSIESLGIVASQKGLIFGNLRFNYKGDRHISISEADGPMLIPLISLNSQSEHFEFRSARFDEIIVIEKDAVFRRLCEVLRGTNKLLVTGKGFPDRLTKVFLHFFTAHYSETPVVCLVDSDVYGLQIFHQYRYSPAVLCQGQTMEGRRKESSTMRFSISCDGEIDNQGYVSSCDRLIYKGVSLFDRQEDDDSASTAVNSRYLPITERDLKRMQTFLAKLIGYSKRDPHDLETPKLIREVRLGMFFLIKKEMKESQ